MTFYYSGTVLFWFAMPASYNFNFFCFFVCLGFFCFVLFVVIKSMSDKGILNE